MAIINKACSEFNQIVLKVLITCPRVVESETLFTKFFDENNHAIDYIYPTKQGFDSVELRSIYDEHELLIVGDDQVNSDFLENALNLKTIIKWGKGVDNIDKKFCTDHRIDLFNSPGNIAQFVAEHGLALILGLLKRLNQNTQMIKKNIWSKDENLSLFNKNIGFYGFGDVANNLSKLVEPFNTKIKFYDIKKINNDYFQVEYDELFQTSDIVIIASELTAENKGIVDFNTLKMMSPSAILINISRGKIINEKDLIRALNESLISGAGLDVLEEEPIDSNNKLLLFDNVIITCHNASNTKQATISVNNEILEILKSII